MEAAFAFGIRQSSLLNPPANFRFYKGLNFWLFKGLQRTIFQMRT